MRVELPRYPAYQPAETEWIGEIPEGWDVLPFKRLCQRVDVGIAEAATHAYAETGVPIIRGTNIRPDRIEGEILYIEPWFAEKNRSKYMWAGDLVTVRTGYPGVTAVIPPEFDKSQCFTMIISTPKKGQVSRFFCYYFNSVGGMAHFEVEGWGSAQTNISVPTVQEILVPFPPQEQQQAIVAFLDRETAKIDRLMTVRQKQVECLREQRTAVIHHAVTKGLDPQAKMKPSDIEWLGDIPATWTIWPVKHLANYRNGFAFKPEHWSDTGDPIIRIQNLTAGNFIENCYDGGLPDCYRIRDGDFIISWSATLRFFKWSGCDAWLNQHLFKVTVHSEPCTKNYYPWLAGWFLDEMAHRAHGSTMVHLTKDAFGSFKVPIPPKDEQVEIVAHIDRETTKIDTLIAKYQRELELLAEYRASLISHAVTGKIDVRGLVEPQSLEAA